MPTTTTRRRGTLLPEHTRRRVVAALLTRFDNDVDKLRLWVRMTRRVASDLLRTGDLPIVADSALAVTIARELIGHVGHRPGRLHACGEAWKEPASASRVELDSLARELGQKAYVRAQQWALQSREMSAWHVDMLGAGIHMAPALSSNGLPMLIVLGQYSRLIDLSETPTDSSVLAHLRIWPRGIHYAPWRPRLDATEPDALGRTMIAVDRSGRLIASMDITVQAMVPAFIETRAILELALEVSEGTAYADPYDDDDESDGDDCGQEWNVAR